MSPPLSLPEDEVHVWYLGTDRDFPPATLVRWEASLDAEERARWQRFAFPEARRQFLISHGFLREVLSSYRDIPPGAWVFKGDRTGKPQVSQPAEARWLSFNLTHTNGLAACVLTRERAVGVDAEDIRRRGGTPSELLVRNTLAPAELAEWEALPDHLRTPAFYDFWTLKEAYLKARGVGLSLPLQEIAFSIRSEPPTVAFGPGIADSPDSWLLRRIAIPDWHRLAIAVRTWPGVKLAVHFCPWPATHT